MSCIASVFTTRVPTHRRNLLNRNLAVTDHALSDNKESLDTGH